MVSAERKRRQKVRGAEVLEIDGLVLCLSNLPDPSTNGIVVDHAPRDSARALADAEEEFKRRGLTVGIDLQVARHPDLDRAVRALGLSLAIEQPGMVLPTADLKPLPIPNDVELRPVLDEDGVAALVRVDADAFGGDPVIGRRFFGASACGVAGVHAFVAWRREEPVGIAVGYEHGGAVGVMGVGVSPAHRRRGLGAALTTHAVRSFPDADLAWLHPMPKARSLYERIGFRRVADHEIWVREPS